MRLTIILIGVMFLVSALIVYKMYNKKHRNIEEEEYKNADAIELYESFNTNEIQANDQYLDKVVAVTGVVADVTTNQEGATVVLLKTRDPLFGVSCTMQESAADIQRGTRVTIKGICKGYLSDVVITRGIFDTR